jgi:phage protein D
LSAVRQPRLRVLADGAALPGAMSADVSSNNHLSADRFRLRFAARGLDPVALAGRLNVQVGLDGGWTSLLLGTADSLHLDPVRGTLDVEGRDLSAALVEARVDETFANRTSSEVAEALAARHGLQADVTATTATVGRLYGSERDRLTMGQFARAATEWDLLAALAGQEGFDLFMDGPRLHFGPPGDAAPVPLPVGGCLSLEVEHRLALTDLKVQVRSWGTRAGAAVSASAGAGGRTHGVVRPNLPQEEAQRLAERTLADLQRHEWAAHAAMPGELALTARSRVQVQGAGPGWDRVFAVAEISRHLDVRRGFTQRVVLQGIPGGAADGQAA